MHENINRTAPQRYIFTIFSFAASGFPRPSLCCLIPCAPFVFTRNTTLHLELPLSSLPRHYSLQRNLFIEQLPLWAQLTVSYLLQHDSCHCPAQLLSHLYKTPKRCLSFFNLKELRKVSEGYLCCLPSFLCLNKSPTPTVWPQTCTRTETEMFVFPVILNKWKP